MSEVFRKAGKIDGTNSCLKEPGKGMTARWFQVKTITLL
jgi:hypothetical protein